MICFTIFWIQELNIRNFCSYMYFDLHIEIIYHCKRHEYCFTIENVSRTFFSQLNKYTFVQMMLITGVLPFLPGSFHKYYALYKFYEFLPHLDLGNYIFTFCFNIFEIICIGYDSQNEPTISK